MISGVTPTGGSPRQGPGRPAGVDSHDTRQRVIDAACLCFARYGYGPSTNNLIARSAGVTAGSVYYHFRSKRTLFAAVCDHVYGGLFARSSHLMTTDISHRDLLAALMRITTTFNHESPGAAAFFVAAAIDAQRHSELAEIYRKEADRVSGTIIAVIERGQAAGLTPKDVDPVLMARLMRAVIFGFSQLTTSTSVADNDAIIGLFESEFLDLPSQ